MNSSRPAQEVGRSRLLSSWYEGFLLWPCNSGARLFFHTQRWLPNTRPCGSYCHFSKDIPTDQVLQEAVSSEPVSGGTPRPLSCFINPMTSVSGATSKIERFLWLGVKLGRQPDRHPTRPLGGRLQWDRSRPLCADSPQQLKQGLPGPFLPQL